jgi:hypothetical protein
MAAVAALVAAGVAGLTAGVALNTGSQSPRPNPSSHAVTPPQTGANVVDQARNLASWLQRHQG